MVHAALPWTQEGASLACVYEISTVVMHHMVRLVWLRVMWPECIKRLHLLHEVCHVVAYCIGMLMLCDIVCLLHLCPDWRSLGLVMPVVPKLVPTSNDCQASLLLMESRN